MPDSSRVGVVTVSYGSGEELERFLGSLREHCGKHLDVVVVDNKPGPDGVESVARAFDALYLPLEDNPGYGAGMNAGVKMLLESRKGKNEFDSWFICNPDVQFVENCITPLSKVLESDETIGAVGPSLLNDDGTTFPSARNIPSVSTGVGHALLGKLWANNPWSRAYKNAAGTSRQRDAGWLSGAAVMVKASVWERIDGFDEAYFLNFEDIDLGYRIGLAGFRNVYVPSTTVQHSGAHSTSKHAEVAERAMHVSAIRFMRKRYAGFWNTPLRWVVVIGLKIRGVIRVAATRRGRHNAPAG